MNVEFRHEDANAMAKPACQSCEKRMWLVRVEPIEPALDKRVFQCPECGKTQNVVVRVW